MPAMHSPDLRCDILIVGGGLAGSAAAYYMARDGADVTVVERFDLNTQASGSNAGSLHAQIPHEEFVNEGEAWARNFAPTIELLLESIRVWQGLEAELGADLEVSVEGGILLAENEMQAADIRRKMVIEHEHGLVVEWIDRAGLSNLAPYAAPSMVGGAFCPTEGKANPLKATPAYVRAAEKHGAKFLTRRNVRNVMAESGGYRIDTSAGPIQARRVVNSAGAEAGRIAGFLGIDLPIEGHPIQVNVTEPVAPFIPHLVYSAGEKLTLKQAKNGSLLIGGGWPARWSAAERRPAVDLASLRSNLATAMAVVPRVASARLLRVWPAIVNGTADWRPILGEVPGLPGFFMNFFPWMGFTAGPLCAQITAALVLGRQPPVDISGFAANLKRA
jgi:sarcosine oxidase subunit beta